MAAGRKFQMAFVPGSIGVEANQVESIALAQRFGFESVEPDGSYLAGLPAGELQRLLDDLNARNLQWAAAVLPPAVRQQQSFADGIKTLRSQVSALQKAGVTRMGTWVTPASNTEPYLLNLKNLSRRLREAAKIVGDYGMRLGLEYIGTKRSWRSRKYTFVHSLAEAKDLIAEIGAGNVGVVLDSWHWWQADDTVEDLLTLTNEQIVSADLNDAPQGLAKEDHYDNQRELPMATGVIDQKGFLEALVKIGYDGPIRAEPFNKVLDELPNEEASRRTGEAMKRAFALVD